MKVNELRLGNIIDFDGMYCEVKEIDNQGVVVYIKDTKETEWIDLFQFTPIQLTEEILLKCGFEENKFSHVYEDDTRFSVYVNDDFFFCQIDNVVINNIKHLHQLQNLYFVLTGKELEFDLHN